MDYLTNEDLSNYDAPPRRPGNTYLGSEVIYRYGVKNHAEKTFHSGIMIVVQMKIYKVLKTTTHLIQVPYSQAPGNL